METTNQKNIATILHLSALTQYFFPFGNFIFPIIIWSAMKRDSLFIDNSGRNAINFQLSIFIYCVLLCMIAIPVLIFTIFSNVPFSVLAEDGDVFIRNFSAENITGIAVVAIMAVVLFIVLKVAEFFLIIYAAVKASNGEVYKYPLTINFIKAEPIFETKTKDPATETEPT